MPTARPGTARPTRTRRRSDTPSDPLDQKVYETLFDDVMHGRLRPGQRLGEATLCERFQVSRTVVRQALRRLAESGILDIVPNKGATVAAPTPRETHEVFEARRAIEAAIVRLVAQHISHGDVDRLHRRLQAEHEALHHGDHRRWVDLAGGFHLSLSQLCRNRVLQRLLADLMTRCSVIVAMYEAPGDAGCEHDEHQRIVELLALRDGDAAAALMEQHLVALQARLVFPEPVDTPGPG